MRTTIIVLAICLAPLAALAETGQSDCPMGTSGDDCTEYRFDDELVDAGPQAGAIDVMHSGTRGRTISLLRVRTHFVPELVKSVEDL